MVHGTMPKWIAVIRGAPPGVYPNWAEAGPKTQNIPGGAIFQGFATEEEANRVFEAARARGEVEEYVREENKFKTIGKPKNAPLSSRDSSLGEEAALLRTPPAESASYSRVAMFRRTMRDSPYSISMFSSPPTDVTQVYAPLYVDDSPPITPIAPPSPHFTFTSSDLRAYPDVSEHTPETDIEEIPVQIDVSDWSLSSLVSSTPSSHLGAEGHTSKRTGCMPQHPMPQTRDKGVKYYGHGESDDPRVWAPKSRVFDPAKVKRRPLTRPSSPAKNDVSPVSSSGTIHSSPQPGCHISLMDTSFVTVDRGRRSKLAPSVSLPIIPDRDPEEGCSSVSNPTQRRLENRCRCTGKGKEEEEEAGHSVHDERLAERPTEYGCSPRNGGRSHVQLVPRDGRDEQSAIMVHCPPSCSHQTSSCNNRLPRAPKTESTGPRYVDACVSPIITITSSTYNADSSAKIRSKRPEFDGFVGFTHVSRHLGLAPEADVRSPIAKGASIPMNVAEMGRLCWRKASRARRLEFLMGLLAISDLACFSVALAVIVVAHVFCALQHTVRKAVSSSSLS